MVDDSFLPWLFLLVGLVIFVIAENADAAMISKRHRMTATLSKLANAAPGSSKVALPSAVPTNTSISTPITRFSPPEAVFNTNRSAVQHLVESAFPFATIAFRPDLQRNTIDASTRGTRQRTGSSPGEPTSIISSVQREIDSMVQLGNSQSYYARCAFAPHECLRNLMGDYVGDCERQRNRQQPTASLFSSTHRETMSVVLGADAVVYLGGYAPTDLSGLVAEKIVAAVPLAPNIKLTPDALRTRQLLDDNRLTTYLKPQAIRQEMIRKGCLVHEDGLEVCFPTGGSASEDEGSSAIVQLGFGNPEWYPSVLNRCDRDDVRLLLRPGFGYSESVLLDRLPGVMVSAARALKRQCGHYLPRNRQPSLAFWLSCVGHVVCDPSFAQQCAAAATRPSSGDARGSANVISVDHILDVVVESFKGSAASSTEGPPIQDMMRHNYFLPVETFEQLPWWSMFWRVAKEFVDGKQFR